MDGKYGCDYRSMASSFVLNNEDESYMYINVSLLGIDSVVLTPPPPADGVCPTDWLVWGSHCYYFSTDELQLGWDDAVDECKRLAGREYVDTCSLASIHRWFGVEL